MDSKNIIDEYRRGKSVPVIARELSVSPWVLYAVLAKAGISRRSASHSNRLRFESLPLSYQPKNNLTLSERTLKVAGLMLYWAEGYKRGHDTVDLANSDPEMIRIFLNFLRQIYGVSEKRLRVLLYCYANQPVTRLIEFWSKLANIPREQFTKPYIREDYSIKKIGKMPHGMVHIRYNDQRLLAQIKRDIGNLTKRMI